MNTEQDLGWNTFWGDLDAFRAAIGRSTAINVNAKTLVESAEHVVQQYFREIRPQLTALGVGSDAVGNLDEQMHVLLRLAHGRNAKRSYQSTLRAVMKERPVLTAIRDRQIGAMGSSEQVLALAPLEASVVSTLREIVPSAANSYEQATKDVNDGSRLSYRGAAADLRESVREVLDYLAPDADVISQPGFKMEKDRHGPTMRQKVRFILKSRGIGATGRKPPEDAVSALDEAISSFVRSTYESSSMSTHESPTQPQVKQLKLYVDSVLAELLHVHDER